MAESKKQPTLYSLAPDPALNTEAVQRYFPAIDAAFDNILMRNIAVTGGFGVGKSSLIRAYEYYRIKGGDKGRNEKAAARSDKEKREEFEKNLQSTKSLMMPTCLHYCAANFMSLPKPMRRTRLNMMMNGSM